IPFLVVVVMSFSNVDPAITALGESASVEAREAYREANGLNDPLLVRYVAFLGGLLQGDLGTFSARQIPVFDEIARALPITLQLTFLGLAVAVAFALVLGVLAALFRDRWPDKAIRVVAVASLAPPSLCRLALLPRAATLAPGRRPASGPPPAPSADLGGSLARMALPAPALAVPVVGQLARVVRTSVVEELDEDYVRTAIGAGI